jgi:hypothetical protein
MMVILPQDFDKTNIHFPKLSCWVSRRKMTTNCTFWGSDRRRLNEARCEISRCVSEAHGQGWQPVGPIAFFPGDPEKALSFSRMTMPLRMSAATFCSMESDAGELIDQ